MKKIFKHQEWHLIILVALLVILYFYVDSDPNSISGSLLGVSSPIWFLIAITSPILHQLYVLLVWRAELHYKRFTKTFGTKAFKLYKFGFGILIISRLVTIVCLAVSNSMTIKINPAFSYTFSALLFIPAAYLFYSVVKYFGIDRAVGNDHFYPQRAKNQPFVNQGIFKYTPNAMYIFGFFILWIPGVIMQSKAALIAALFNHIYIWVHYYFTEHPDIKVIYGENK